MTTCSFVYRATSLEVTNIQLGLMQQATKRLGDLRCDRKSYYNTGESCSVWFEPNEVWEIRGADLTISPVHKAAIGRIEANVERGVSLR